jgi:hypothetical protein
MDGKRIGRSQNKVSVKANVGLIDVMRSGRS